MRTEYKVKILPIGHAAGPCHGRSVVPMVSPAHVFARAVGTLPLLDAKTHLYCKDRASEKDGIPIHPSKTLRNHCQRRLQIDMLWSCTVFACAAVLRPPRLAQHALPAFLQDTGESLGSQAKESSIGHADRSPCLKRTRAHSGAARIYSGR